MHVSRSGSLLVLLLTSVPVPLHGSTLERFEFRQIHMGVETRLVFYAPEPAAAVLAATRAFQRIATLDSIMSDYRADSELNRLVARAGGPPVVIGEELFLVLSRAQELARLSDGAFDVTSKPLVELWREARRTGVLPPDHARRAAAQRVGWRNLRLDPANRTAQLVHPEMRLDLGGIGKGYASDEAIATLRAHGIEHALVEMGGDIVAGDAPPGEKGWRIQLVRMGSLPDPIFLANAAISTSGDTEQFVEIGGVRYSHIVDPRTGLGLRSRIAVTVLAPDGITADGLSTLLSVLGADRVDDFIATHFPGVEAWTRFVGEAGIGTLPDPVRGTSCVESALHPPGLVTIRPVRRVRFRTRAPRRRGSARIGHHADRTIEMQETIITPELGDMHGPDEGRSRVPAMSARPAK
jgi:FAD:protein FMN transferase